MTRDERLETLLGAALVMGIGGTCALEGGTLPAYGGVGIIGMCAVAAVAVWVRGVDPLDRWPRVLLAALGVVLVWHAFPIPEAIRAVVAPGQARWLDAVAPEFAGDADAFVGALTRFDVLAAVGVAGPWDVDPIAGSVATNLRTGSVYLPGWAWSVAKLGGFLAAFLAGSVMGRSERGVRVVALGLVALGVVQAILGIAWRDGPSTGIGEKVYYLGSATGTFINRGHFGAFLCLALGSAWGLAAALFPLVPDEVRRHWRSRRRSSQPPNVLEVSGDKVPRLVVLGFAVSVMGVALVLSQSRAPILAFAIASLAGAAYCWRRRDETFHLGIAVGVLAVSAFLSGVGFGVRGAFGRFASLLSTTDVSFTSRVQVWKEGLAAVLDAPVFGAGPGAWRIGWALHEAGPHLYDFSHAHNEIVERLVEIGIVGTAAMLGLAAIWVHRCRMGLDVAEHGPRTAVGVGAAVGVVAVALQSLGDFPLHTPGVLLATGVCAGVARGALTERAGPGRPTMWLLPLAGTVLFSGVAVARDVSHPGTREERLSEHPAWIHREGVDDSVDQRQSRLEEARALADVSPLDPWAHVATALGAARVAVDAAAGRSVDGAWEERAWEAEKAVARAMKLRPRLPRLELACARVLLALAESGSGEDARRERATVMLAHAISLDAWRAREAFEMASTLPADSLSRMADAAPAEATSRARVRYELSRALHRRKDADGAYGALLDAMEADPTFGPALYEAGVQLQARGEGEAARGYFERFLQAKERTPGMEGWALLHMSDLDGAEVRFRRIVAEKPQNLWAWEGLAEIARIRGDKAAELQVWRRVVRINPEHRTAGARIAALAGP